ncbi:MAG: 6-carboxytetrahydropterin synthase [Bryobacterales bacterium]|nr:6-carboxytetrahydropterin synthase [Bryobacteraceae bacterium]MDW8354030.1 6-carboxytetrahydropterin synthase [Bryobacterales bacterium]
MILRLTRRYRFAAAHRLHAAAFSQEANQQLYGKCNNPHGHGHDYVLEVSVAGPLDEATGRVANPAVLDRLVAQEVLACLDHRNLNAEVAEFSDAPPTTENLLRLIRQRLLARWPETLARTRLAGIRLYETRRNIFELAERS